ncbi:MAG: NAD-dependent DNA ligase LigA [Bacteroidota bacterium]
MPNQEIIERNLSTTNDWLTGRKTIQKREELEELKDLLLFHEHRYYVMNEPLLTDPEYDQLYKKLEIAEEQYPEWITPDSPTQRVGSSLNAAFTTAEHIVPMLSLENSYNAADLNDWDRKAREMSKLPQIEYCIEPKFDGASISVIYENDYLLRSVTRGDGIQGDDITTNSRQIRNIPLKAGFSDFGIQQIEIRGEVLMSKKAFAFFNERLSEEGLAPLANPRNAAAGSLRMKNPKEVAKRSLEAFFYHVSYLVNQPSAVASQNIPETHSAMLEMLWQSGFRSPVKESKVVQGINAVIDYCNSYEQTRDELPYEIDGMVIKVNDLKLQEKLGMTTHHPRWAIAFKFKARQASTRLLAIEFQVGRTGAVTPVAKLQPVGIGGVTVGSISVHNEEYIREKDLRLGDMVIIERAGDVIPQIVRPLVDQRNGSEQLITYTTICPACQSKLFKETTEAVWRCINAECPAQVIEKMIHFVSKDAMDIRSFGEQQVRKFYELGLLNDIPGIYRLDFTRLGKLEGFGQKSIDNLRASIEQSKQQPLHRLIYGLGIRHVGETTAKALARRVSHISELKIITIDELMQLEDFGPKVANSVHQFFQNPQNIAMLHELEEIGINMTNQKSSTTNDSAFLNGKSFVFTGTLSKLKRSDAEEMVEKAGGQILSGVSSKLNYLVVGEDAGSKHEKAKKIPSIHIISEDDFLKLFDYDQKT